MFKKVYLSGPITGTEDAPERFTLAALRVTSLGCAIVNPVEFNKSLPEGTPWEVYMKNDMKLLAQCDTIYMMHGWAASRGAKQERDFAIEKGMNIIYEDRLHEKYYA